VTLPSLRAWLLLVLLGGTSVAAPALAQPPLPPPAIAVAPEGTTQELRLRDGSTVYGRVEAVADGRVTFRLQSGGTLELASADVVSLAIVEGRVVATEFWKDDPNPTRLFFGPTARALERGEVYLGVYEIFMPFVQVGVTDRISIGGGTPLIFGGGGDRPFWFTPKVTFVDRARTQVAAGAMHILNVDGDNLGIVYAAATQGTRDTAVSVGLGYAYERFEDNGAPVLMIGAEHRVRRNLKLVTENYVFEGGGIVSAGVRFITGRLSADLGLAAPVGVDEVVVFPMVNFVWTFQ
jgi:hypothetical protein